MSSYKQVGEHKHLDRCRFCGNDKIVSFLDLGYMPLAGGFIKAKDKEKAFVKEKFYPLQVCFCPNCYLVQANDSVPPDLLFKHYFYFSSAIKTLVDHFEINAEELKREFPYPNKRLIVEIGCNDGAFTNALIKRGFRALGIDPATNIVRPLVKKGAPILNSYFSEALAKEVREEYGKADAIMSFHSLAHIEDMHDVMRGIKLLLKKDGFLAFEVHYLGSLLGEMQYDMIYHEHQYYYSLLALKNFFDMYDMEIYNVKSVPIRGGSMMYYVQNKAGVRKILKNVADLIRTEQSQGLHKIKTYLKFAERVKRTKQELLTLLKDLKKKHKRIIGYGASGRGTIIMNFCGLGEEFLDCVVDDAPEKHGAYMPGMHLEISPSDLLDRKNKPDYVLLFAWPFFEEIKQKKRKYLEKGGKFIVPLPRVSIISA